MDHFQSPIVWLAIPRKPHCLTDEPAKLFNVIGEVGIVGRSPVFFFKDLSLIESRNPVEVRRQPAGDGCGDDWLSPLPARA